MFLKSPIPWFGGKFYMIPELLQMIPPHHAYVEVFGGGGSLLFAKLPSPVETYNDLDSRLANFFRILRDKNKFEEFRHQVSLVPYSREEFYSFRDTYEESESDIERAVKFFCVARMSFSGLHGHSWGFCKGISHNGMAGTCSKYLAAIDRLSDICGRLSFVQIENLDFRKIFKNYDSPKTFFYCDPPYVSSTRKDGEYAHELVDKDHRDEISILLEVEGKVILSGYQNDLYLPLELAGWERKDFSKACYSVGRTKATGLQGEGALQKKQYRRTESVWISPHSKKQLTLF